MLWVLLQNSPWPFLFNMTILSTISQNILVRFLLKVLPRVENTHSEGTELNTIWIDIEFLVFFAATRHFAFFDWFHKISGLNSVLKVQGVQDQNFRIQTAITQELCTWDHKLVKPKCVWEIYIFSDKVSFLKKLQKSTKF